jgi:hypothetical protein
MLVSLSIKPKKKYIAQMEDLYSLVDDLEEICGH